MTAGVLLSAVSAVSAEKPGSLPHEARVAVPVADLRGERAPAGPTLEHDPMEESQLLYGEPVQAFEETEGWVRVEAVEQQEWSHHEQWEGYPGWIEKSSLLSPAKDWAPNLIVISKSATVRGEPAAHATEKLTLSIGSLLMELLSNERGWRRVRLLDGSSGWLVENEAAPFPVRFSNYPLLRQNLVRTARLFIGDPYYWGGRAARTGLDCSSLTGLAHQANGLRIPRDAQEQWMKARPLNRDQLKPGDLVFLSNPKDPRKITHVMLYAGDGRVIEGPGTGEKVREIEMEPRLKEAEKAGRKVFYGTYLP